MSNDSEKGNNTWKQGVVYFLLLLAFLVSVLILILIVDTWWYPKLLKLPEIFTKIITVIILLISVSLLSFSVQIYMYADPGTASKIWKIVAYPIHWAFRVADRLRLLAIRLAILILLLILLMTSIVSLKVFDSALSKGFELVLSETLVENPETLVENSESLEYTIIKIIIVVIAMVLIPYQLQGHAKGIWESLLYSKERICKVLRGR